MDLPPLDSALSLNARKELFSYAFIAAIAASANCDILHPKMDFNSVDCQLMSTADTCPQISLQVKATAEDSIKDGVLTFDLPIKNFVDLRRPRAVPNMLVVVHLPTAESDWLKHGADMISLHNSAYYLNIKNLPDSSNTTSVSVKIPTSQALHRASLEQLLAHVSRYHKLP